MHYLLVGLGNPGAKYQHTRHNIGFDILDTLAKKEQLVFTNGNLVEKTEWSYGGHKIILIKPQTFMNLSGKAVQYWMHWFKIPIENVLVIVDDIALPTGKIRFRKGGSAAGHNGLKNIELLLGTKDYPRLRFGVGNNFPAGKQADFVLSSFNADDRATVLSEIDTAMDGIKSFILQGIDKTMSIYNSK
jgi:PTH1 family peptidyl-tRNA hydrolase